MTTKTASGDKFHFNDLQEMQEFIKENNLVDSDFSFERKERLIITKL